MSLQANTPDPSPRAENEPTTAEIPAVGPLLPPAPEAGAAQMDTAATGSSTSSPRRRIRWTVAAMTAAALLVAGGIGGVVADTVQRQSTTVADGPAQTTTAAEQTTLLSALDHVHEGIEVDFSDASDDDAGSSTSSTDAWGGGQGGFGGREGRGTLPGARQSTVDAGAEVTDADGVLLIETSSLSGGGAGTGMVLTAEGLALTNYHVVDGSTEVQVTVADTGDTYTATVVGRDATHDVAVLQLQDVSGLETVSVDGSGVSTQEAVAAVGNGSGQGYLTAVTGTVTAMDREITASSGDYPGADAETLTDLIQTDADVVGGYSGGPLVDAEGQVVGISTAASTGTSTEQVDGYAIPIAAALEIADQVAAGTESDTVQVGSSGALGVTVTAASSAAGSGLDSSSGAVGPVPGMVPERFEDEAEGDDAQRGEVPSGGNAGGDGQEVLEGALVVEVAEGSAAEAAGLTAGDTITAADGTEVADAAELSSVVSSHEPGEQIVVEWVDEDGQTQQTTVTLQASTVN